MLSLLFLAAVISLSFLFLMQSLSPCIDVSTQSSTLVNPLTPSFLVTYSLSMSSLRCTALCIVVNVLVLWSICLSSSLFHFRNGPENLIRKLPKFFISLIRFFLIFLKYSFLIFPFISTCLMVSASQVLVIFLLSKRSNSLLKE